MDHLLDDEELPRHEREVTLSTGAILGIFLGLAVLCGGFFGFGYNMGRKSAPTPLSLSDVPPDNTSLQASGSTAGISVAKPSAGTPLGDTPEIAPPVTSPRPVHRPPPIAAHDEDTLPSTSTSEEATVKPTLPRPTGVNAAHATPAPIIRQPAPVAPSSLNPAASGTATSGAGSGTFMVQVAAVSHQEDADLLVGALHSRGYTVSAHPGANDRFIHVQVGPFHDKKEADAMRQRLLTDGYNAIVK